MLPSLVAQFVTTLKETSLGYIIGLSEVSFIAGQINAQVLTQPVAGLHDPGAHLLRALLRAVARGEPCWRSERAQRGGAMIEFRNVSKFYGSFRALDDVTETIARGEVVVVCGPSGSGKSTLIRTINRLEPIDSGQILLNGQDIHRPGLDVDRFRSGIGFVFQQFNLFPHLSVLENCTLAPMKRARPRRARKRASAPSPCSIAWASRARRRPIPRSSRAASSSASPLPARSRWSRR